MLAFLYVLQASAVGKVVVSAPHLEQLQPPDASLGSGQVVITGGLGSLGLMTANWLVQQHGINHINLVSVQPL